MAAALTTTTLKSQNGWPASDNPAAINIITVAVPLKNGTKRMQVAAGIAPAMIEMLKWWDENVEPVTELGSYNFREIRGYEGKSIISNHGSGTAIDINASKHPLGVRGTVPALIAARLVAKATSLGLRWGGTYKSRADDMHFEAFSPTLAAVAQKTAVVAVQGATAGMWFAALGLLAFGGLWVYRRVKGQGPV